MESAAHRARRKFVFGALEQASNILGAMTASTVVVGLVLPTLAVLSGSSHVTQPMLAQLAMLVLGFAMLSATAAVVLRGLARRLEDNDVADADRQSDAMEGPPQ